VILETGLIPTPELKITASLLAAEAGAAFVKTCTGFAAGGGATKEDVGLMYRAVRYKGGVKVKASGGVRSFDACRAMFLAGAERIGTYVFPFYNQITYTYTVTLQVVRNHSRRECDSIE